MEKTNTWSDFLTKIISEYTDDENRNMSWRNKNIITSLPLYEVKFYKEYGYYAEETYKKLSEGDDSIFKMWKLAMYPSTDGFSDFDFFKKLTMTMGDIITSTWHIKQNHHYFKYEANSNKKINEFDRIIELGGGCGDMCKFIKNMGFTGDYTLIDLPEVLTIQQNNLLGYNGITFTDKLPQPHTKKRTLFISTWALSEVPVNWRNEVINTLQPENYLIIYQREFEDISNEDWFSTWKGYREELEWIPWDGGSSYIIN
tara:strand:- start:312 stop:1082 length:771 start_codon:yes stop_codon:yes gene_type:complete